MLPWSVLSVDLLILRRNLLFLLFSFLFFIFFLFFLSSACLTFRSDHEAKICAGTVFRSSGIRPSQHFYRCLFSFIILHIPICVVLSTSRTWKCFPSFNPILTYLLACLNPPPWLVPRTISGGVVFLLLFLAIVFPPAFEYPMCER